jgi:hypothetical protein
MSQLLFFDSHICVFISKIQSGFRVFSVFFLFWAECDADFKSVEKSVKQFLLKSH